MIKFDNKVITINNDWLKYDPYNPLGLPPYTIRLKYVDGHTPTFSKGTGVQISSSPNIWDLTYENNDWSSILYNHHNKLIEVLGANTTGVTNMNFMFYNCQSITSIQLFDTSNVTDMIQMFGSCYSLTTVPLFNTGNVTNMESMFGSCKSLISIPLVNTSNVTEMGAMFYGCKALKTVPLLNTSNVTEMGSAFWGCINVESGALSLYQQASTQSIPPARHNQTFYNCGINTQTGSAELAQIPSDWK